MDSWKLNKLLLLCSGANHQRCGVRVKSVGLEAPHDSFNNIFHLVSEKKAILEEMRLPDLESGDSSMTVLKGRSSE